MTDRPDQVAHFLSAASFWSPEQIVESAWLQHAPFAFWLMNAARPDVVVELGTHVGFSYFCFCEAAERSVMPSKLYAVDTWEGDAQAGFYGGDVLTSVEAHNAARYSGRSTLMRMRFDEALDRFADGSIDLLHIDGAHGYDDVRGDFKAWLPKLSPHGVILFHDVAVEREGFGVKRLWAEIGERYPHFTFHHGFGLGVLGVGPALPDPIERLLSLDPASPMTELVRDAYARLGRAVQLDHDLRFGARVLQLRQAALEAENARLRQAAPKESGTDGEPSPGEVGVAALAQRLDSLCNHNGAALSAAVAFLNSLMRRLDQADMRLARERAQAATLGNDVVRLETELADADSRRADLEATNASLAVRLRQAEDTIARLRGDLIDAEASAAVLARGSRLLTPLSPLKRKLAAFRLVRNPLFDGKCYVEKYMKRNASRFAAAEHFLREGFASGCNPNPLFDTRWYLTHYDDVRRSGENPLMHYFAAGWAEGRNPGPGFDTAYYLEHNPDVAKSGMNPLAHFLRFGRKEGRQPKAASVDMASVGFGD